VVAAIGEQRWGDALRRAHDMKGLAGTIGARRLHEATQALHAALTRQAATPDGAEIARVRPELERVLREIDRIVPRA
jgi:HPt (histidine-containing phosphotransfer) domain-containing protein